MAGPRNGEHATRGGPARQSPANLPLSESRRCGMLDSGLLQRERLADGDQRPSVCRYSPHSDMM